MDLMSFILGVCSPESAQTPPENKKMKKIVDGFCRSVFFPISFVFADLYKFCLFYCGLAYGENRAYDLIYPAGCAVFALVCGICFLYVVRENVKSRRAAWGLVLPAFALLFFAVFFAMGIVRGGTGNSRAYNIALFALRCIPAFMGGVSAAVLRTEDSFCAVFERFAFVIAPGSVIYFVMSMLDSSIFTDGTYLGTINYMSFAYTLVPVLICLVLRFYENAPMRMPFSEREMAHPNLFRAAAIIIFWVDIISSGTRGAYLAVVLFCIAAFLWRVLSHRSALHGFILSGVMAAIIVVNIFLWAPAGMKGVERINIFFDGIKDGDFTTTDTEDPVISDQIDAALEDVLNGKTDEIEIDHGYRISDRGSIYKLALAEFLRAPVFGMGQGEFQEKYKVYPHNMFLEMLCETGIVGTLPLVLLLVVAVAGILRAARRSRGAAEILLLLGAYFVRENISNSIWQSVPLLAVLGFGLTLAAMPMKTSGTKPEGESE